MFIRHLQNFYTYVFSNFTICFRKCPPTLAAAVTREVYDQATKIDFREFEDRSNEPENEGKEENEIHRPESGRESVTLSV